MMHTSIKLGLSLSLLSSAALIADISLAKDAKQSASPLDGVYACQSIDNADQRLACFDQAVVRLHTAESNKELVAIDAKAAKKLKREAFGFNLPSLPKLGLPKFGLGGKQEALVEPVKSIRKSRNEYVITLTNGQVWRQYSGSVGYIPKGPLKARIKALKMGGFTLSLSNGKRTAKGLRVKRIK